MGSQTCSQKAVSTVIYIYPCFAVNRESILDPRNLLLKIHCAFSEEQVPRCLHNITGNVLLVLVIDLPNSKK